MWCQSIFDGRGLLNRIFNWSASRLVDFLRKNTSKGFALPAGGGKVTARILLFAEFRLIPP
jgi:hypothetical protein